MPFSATPLAIPLSIVRPSNHRQPAFRRGAGPNCALEPGEIPHFSAIFRRFRPSARQRLSATAPCVALPPASDLQGWRKRKRIVGTILAMRSSATAPCVALGSGSCFALSPPSMESYLPHLASGWRKCKRIVGTILALQSDAGNDLDLATAALAGPTLAERRAAMAGFCCCKTGIHAIHGNNLGAVS